MKAEEYFNIWSIGREAEVMDAKFRMVAFAEAYLKSEVNAISDEMIEDFINKNEPFLEEYGDGVNLGTDYVSLRLYIKLAINKLLKQ